MFSLVKVCLFVTTLLLAFFTITDKVFATEVIKPTLNWKRSTEAQNKIVISGSLGTGVNAALSLPLDTGQTVFDNGTFTPQENKNSVPQGSLWASWPQYSKVGNFCGPNFELRHFQAKFNLPAGLTVKKVILSSPYYADPTYAHVLPINDNAYIFLNGNSVAQLGTSYPGVINRGFGGTAPIANETDGWIANGDLDQNPANSLKAGENTLDVVAEEYCLWGGLGNLELKLEVEGTILNVPYFNQTNSPWGPQEYDHANTKGPFWCGHTIAQCGCAVTSAAMLLKYYGVDKSPDGQPTTPETLNNWLKTHSGYNSLGAIMWQSIATYSLKASEKFGYQKIMWRGVGGSNDFATLNNELNNNRPTILSVKEGSHFVVATGIQGVTYSINDPISQNNLTLQKYNNVFQSSRLYAPTSTDLSTIYISTPAPNEILIIDSLGRKVGKDPITGIVYNEIPNSFYFLEPTLVDDSIENAPLPPAGSGTTTVAIINPEAGLFNIEVSNLGTNVAIDFAGYDRDGDISTQEFTQTVPQGGTQNYTLNYSPEPGSQIQVTQIIDIDIKPGSDPNSINLKSNGVIPVAILTTPSFDATQVDVSTVRFGSGEATEIHNKGHLEDVDSDGDIDMVLHFRTQETGIQNTETQACLTGTTFSGNPIQGCDSIEVIH